MTTNRSTLQRLQVALDANAAAYRRAAQTSAPGDCWDFVILTAANEKQAAGYRQELALRHRAVGPAGAFFPAIQRSVVVPDPPGRRAGSGGATLGVMQHLARHCGVSEPDFARLRILLIHSGGASQRLPAYSPLGKIFAPLPLLRPDGQISTLFDHLYLTLAGLPERLGPGMLVLAGDVFLLFDHRHVHTPTEGVTALSMRVEADLGRGHGVYVTDANARIQKTLQKAPLDEMRSAGAVDDRGRVLIDTGLLFFDAQRTALLARLAGGACPDCAAKGKKPSPGLHEQYKTQIDLYEDMTAALAAATESRAYAAAGQPPEMRKKLWQALHGVPFSVMELEGQFLHLGTTRQFRDAMVGHNRSPAAELFQQNVLTHSHWPLEAGRRVYHSALMAGPDGAGLLGPSSVIEHSILAGNSHIGAGSVVSQVMAVEHALELGENLLLFQVPVRQADGEARVVHVLCGVEDDFKGLHAQGKCHFLNHDITLWLKRHHVAADEIWPDVPAPDRRLWNARLFAGTPRRDAAREILWMGRSAPAGARAVAAWRKCPRFSMAMLLEQADPVALIEHREVVSAYLQTSALIDAIARDEDKPVEGFIGHYATAAAYEAAAKLLCDWAARPPETPAQSLRASRALWCAAQLLQRPDHPDPAAARQRLDDHMKAAFAKVAEASEPAAPVPPVPSPAEASRAGTAHLRASRVGTAHLRPTGAPRDRRSPHRPSPATAHFPPASPPLAPGTLIEATAPVRLDLAGGWTDTPPYCYERGGHVLNVAINLEGQPPVRATVKTTAEPLLVFESQDLGQRLELRRLDRAPTVDVRDPFALHKVAMGMVGLLPQPAGNIPGFLRKLGAGLIVSTECRVPKGSGLGTSSILGATLLAALHRLLGREPTSAELIGQTLLLEQRLSTGGCWQDQVGGIVAGVKSTLTPPGIPQQPSVEPLALDDAQLQAIEDRLVVYYSGQQRLARDILRRVMGRWLGREPSILLLMEELKTGAAALRTALLKGQWSIAARHIARYWQIKKELYPGSTTPMIDVLFLELREHYLAAGLAGAGGGGFAYFFCKDRRQSTRLRQALAERSAQPGSMGSLFATQINRTGLTLRQGNGGC